MDFIIVGIIFGTLYGIVALFVRQKERNKLLTLMIQGHKIDLEFLKRRSLSWEGNSVLHIAGISVGVGLGIVVGIIIKAITRLNCVYVDEAIIGGAVLLFGGLGLVVSIIIEKKNNKK